MNRKAILTAVQRVFHGRGLLSVTGLGCLCAALFTVGLIWGLIGTGASLILIDAMKDDRR